MKTLFIRTVDGQLVGDYVQASGDTSAAAASPTVGSGRLPIESPAAVDPAIARNKRIVDFVGDWVDLHPGTTFRTAYMNVKLQNPDLFPGMDNLDVREANALVQQKLLAAIDQLRRKKPHLTFNTAWARLQAEQPSLFNFQEAD